MLPIPVDWWIDRYLRNVLRPVLRSTTELLVQSVAGPWFALRPSSRLGGNLYRHARISSSCKSPCVCACARAPVAYYIQPVHTGTCVRYSNTWVRAPDNARPYVCLFGVETTCGPGSHSCCAAACSTITVLFGACLACGQAAPFVSTLDPGSVALDAVGLLHFVRVRDKSAAARATYVGTTVHSQVRCQVGRDRCRESSPSGTPDPGNCDWRARLLHTYYIHT